MQLGTAEFTPVSPPGELDETWAICDSGPFALLPA